MMKIKKDNNTNIVQNNTENYTWIPFRIGVRSAALEGYTTPAPRVAPVVLSYVLWYDQFYRIQYYPPSSQCFDSDHDFQDTFCHKCTLNRFRNIIKTKVPTLSGTVDLTWVWLLRILSILCSQYILISLAVQQFGHERIWWRFIQKSASYATKLVSSVFFSFNFLKYVEPQPLCSASNSKLAEAFS